MTGVEVKETDENGSYSWIVRPYQEAPQRRFAIIAVATLGGLFGYVLFQHPLPGLIGFGMILGSTMEFWLGTSYRIDTKGASSRTGPSLTLIEWSEVKRLINEDHGVKLSPLERASRLDAFRGVFLKYDRGNREQVWTALRKFGGDHVRSLEI